MKSQQQQKPKPGGLTSPADLILMNLERKRPSDTNNKPNAVKPQTSVPPTKQPPKPVAPANNKQQSTTASSKPKPSKAALSKYDEVDDIFGGMSINRKTLHAPEKPIQVDQLAKRPPPPPIRKVKPPPPPPINNAKNNQTKAKRRERGSSTRSGKSEPSIPAPKSATAIELEKRIAALKAKMAPVQKVRSGESFSEEDDYEDDYDDDEDEDESEEDTRKKIPSDKRSSTNGHKTSDSAARMKRKRIDDSDEDGFDDDDDDDMEGGDWRSALRRATGYDPRKYKHRVDDDDDRNMESSFGQMSKEEIRSLRVGMKEDAIELEREKQMQQRAKQGRL